MPDWASPDGPWCLKEWMALPGKTYTYCVREPDHDGDCKDWLNVTHRRGSSLPLGRAKMKEPEDEPPSPSVEDVLAKAPCLRNPEVPCWFLSDGHHVACYIAAIRSLPIDQRNALIGQEPIVWHHVMDWTPIPHPGCEESCETVWRVAPNVVVEP